MEKVKEEEEENKTDLVLNQMFSPVQSSAEEEVRAHEGES